MSDKVQTLESLPRGSRILFGGDRTIAVPDDVAERFRPGDAVVVVESTEEVLLIPAAERKVARDTVARAQEAFSELNQAPESAISAFYEGFARNLESNEIWARIQQANDQDVADAQRRGRSTTRLLANEALRQGMVEGLRGWIDYGSRRGQVLETVNHAGWSVDLVGAALGIVAFVFEGRPNVLADATGVLRGGNAVVFRIGRDALGTARTIMAEALTPALVAAHLPEHAVCLVDSPAHAAGWALFSDSRLGLAVARGSGPAVASLGSLAQQAGNPVSLHGTGGAWIMASENSAAEAFGDAVFDSLDRKVCNTLNTCCIPATRADELVPVLLAAMERAGQRLGQSYKLHVVRGDEAHVPAGLFTDKVSVRRAGGDVQEPQAEPIDESQLGHEWEWEQTPEVTLKIVGGLDQAITLFNRYSPQFVACLISDEASEHEHFYSAVNAPFVGDADTRWVDGQKALRRPELGLSNWQWGRLFGRGGVLSGDSVYSVRTRARRGP